MENRKKVIGGAITLGISAVGFIVLATPTAAIARTLRFWAYPTLFGVNMLLSGLVLLIILPATGKKGVVWPWLRNKLSQIETKLTGQRWGSIMKRGAFIFVLFATLVFGPLGGAVAIRVFGLREDHAWACAFFTNLVSTAFWVSIYLGDILKDSLATLFAF